MRSMILRSTSLISLLLIFVTIFTYSKPIFVYINLNKINLENSRAMNAQRMLNISAYRHLLKLWPGNFQIQWRLGTFLAETGELDEAVDMLLPFLHSKSADQTIIRSILTTIIKANRSNDALYVYNTLSHNSQILPQFTAYVAQEYLKRDNRLPGTQQDSMLMLTRALGLSINSPEYDLLLNRLQSADFWISADGKRVKTALKWKAQINDRQLSSVLKNEEQLASLHDSVAVMLNIPGELIILGPEVSVNGDFEIQESCSSARNIIHCCCSANWLLSFMSTGKAWNRGMFLIGTDNKHFLSGNRALRIDGVIIDRRTDLEPARAGVWHPAVEIEAGASYVISFVYQTQDVAHNAVATYLSTVPITFKPIEKFFPPSLSGWQQVIVILPNHRPQTVTIQPLLRLWSEGTVWFDNFSIRKLDIQKAILIPEIVYYLP